MFRRLAWIAAAFAFVLPGSTFAAGGGGEPLAAEHLQQQPISTARRSAGQPTDPSLGDQVKAKKKKRQDNRSEWRDLYRLAVNQVQDGQYETAIATFVALKEADSPDVENYLGYANRKMGRMEEARVHYENALALDPDHRGALEYFGEWHVEMGKLDDAKGLLQRLGSVCGTNCQEYQALADAIAAKRVH